MAEAIVHLGRTVGFHGSRMTMAAILWPAVQAQACPPLPAQRPIARSLQRPSQAGHCPPAPSSSAWRPWGQCIKHSEGRFDPEGHQSHGPRERCAYHDHRKRPWRHYDRCTLVKTPDPWPGTRGGDASASRGAGAQGPCRGGGSAAPGAVGPGGAGATVALYDAGPGARAGCHRNAGRGGFPHSSGTERGCRRHGRWGPVGWP